MRVLVVDDSPWFQRSMQEFLEQLHAVDSISFAANAQDGLIAALHARPQLVLLDLMLPDMSGIEALPYFTLLEPAPAVILTSIGNSPEYSAMARSAGADGFVPKDALVDELPELLWLNEARLPAGREFRTEHRNAGNFYR